MTDSSKFNVDLFWSMRSPFCYLALDRLMEIERNFNVFINVRPVWPIAIRKPDFFKTVNPKYRRYHTADCTRIAEYLGIPFRRPPVPDPIIQDEDTLEVAEEQPYIRTLTLLCAAAQVRGAGLAFLDRVSRLLWDGSTDNWHEGSYLIDAMNDAGLNGHALMADIEADPKRFEDVIAENEAVQDASDHWGVPLMVYNGETFYGQDRVHILLWRMMQDGLEERVG
ncbi:MAG: DsbA family protein [Rhodospirillales bacterium]